MDCGNQNYYKDTTGIIFRPDLPGILGTTSNSDLEFRERRTFFKENYDWTVHKSERTSKDPFSY